jgi:hypothetical protein
MEHMRIKRVSEADFDAVIKEAGGSRIDKPDSADYVLNEALIELKLAMKEGFEVRTRQQRLVDIFQRQQPKRPVVVIRPNSLDESGRRDYYNAVAGPIEGAVEKAARQLDKTAQRMNPRPVRVLVILNIGYTGLSKDEFNNICFKCTHKRNYNGRIDWLVCGGIYYASDGFDNRVLSIFDDFPINVSCSFPSSERLRDSWHGFVSRMLRESFKGEIPLHQAKLPIDDLAFEVGGVRYVKPSPRNPKSNRWPSGQAPRRNTANDAHAHVALTFPALSEKEWKLFKRSLPTVHYLQPSYREWLDFLHDEESNLNQPLEPFVPVSVTYEDFLEWVSKPITSCEFSDICRFSAHQFNLKVLDILGRAKEQEQTTIIVPEYIYLVVQEIGQDKANDLSSIYHVSETPGFERQEAIIENAQLYWEYGASVAAAYAVKRNVDIVMYSKMVR